MTRDFNIRGRYGEAYVQVLAFSVGLTATREDVDVRGVDLTIGYPGTLGGLDCPCIEVQVKTWAGATPGDADWRYRLSVPHFNHLAGTNRQVPRYLVVLRVPGHSESAPPLAELSGEGLLLRHEARYADLSGFPKRPSDESGTVPVNLSRANTMDPAAIRRLVHADLDVEVVA